jgi:hypothetical protein
MAGGICRQRRTDHCGLSARRTSVSTSNSTWVTAQAHTCPRRDAASASNSHRNRRERARPHGARTPPQGHENASSSAPRYQRGPPNLDTPVPGLPSSAQVTQLESKVSRSWPMMHPHLAAFPKARAQSRRAHPDHRHQTIPAPMTPRLGQPRRADSPISDAPAFARQRALLVAGSDETLTHLCPGS